MKLTHKDVGNSATSDNVRFIKRITCVSFSVATKNCDAEHTKDACSSSSSKAADDDEL